MRRLIVFIVGLALVTACSKEEEEPKVILDEPAVPMTNYVTTGIFEGEWDNMTEPTKGSITVNNEYIFIDELPAEGILKRILVDIQDAFLAHPEKKEELVDSIGNIFFAESYKYPKTDLVIKYQMDSYSDKAFTAKVSSIKNTWSSITTYIESPVSGETIVIGPPEPNTISFVVEADGVSYRVDLISKDHECFARFNMNDNPWSIPGMWSIEYWFNTYRFINLQTGRQKELHIVYSILPHRPNKEDTIVLRFFSKKLVGSIEERIIPL